MALIGVISDTHGLLRPEAVASLQGVDLIVHAGDIGAPDIVPALQEIAPVLAIRGNIDHAPWAAVYEEVLTEKRFGVTLHVLHDVNTLAFDPAAAGIDVVISGHSHAPKVARRDGVLYVNPGSAGRRRFRLPVSLATLTVEQGVVSAELQELAV